MLAQTYKNIEIILVNDGSKDNSLEIIRELEKNYPDIIKVFTGENNGKEAARNLGIENAEGEYLTFLDSDDWLDNDYIEKLHAAAIKSEVVVSGYKRYSNNYELLYESVPQEDKWSMFRYCATAGKMYSAEFINKNQLRYKKFNLAEDAYFCINAYALTNKVCVLPYAGYCYYENFSSITNSKKYDKNDSLVPVLKELDYVISQNCNIDKELLAYYYIKTLVFDVLLHKDYVDCRYITREFKENVVWYKSVLSKMDLKFKFHFQRGERSNVNLIVNTFIAAYKLHCVAILMWLLKKVKLKLM